MSAPGKGTAVKLKFPVTIGSETVDTVYVEKPKGKHLRGVGDPTSLEGNLKLVGNLINQAPSFVDEIDLEDMAEIGKVVADFLPDGLQIG